MGCTYKGLEEIELFFQVVSFILSISSVLWITVVKGTRQKCSHQDVGSANTEPCPVSSGQGSVDTCKKAKTGLENQGDVYLDATIVDTFLTLCSQVCHSSRENKGSGGQVAQLQTLEPKCRPPTGHQRWTSPLPMNP